MNSLDFDIHIASAERQLVDVKGFALPLGRISVLFGESGIGKTLIARAIYGLLDLDEFSVSINGEGYEKYLRRRETVEIKENGFFVFQEPSSHLNPLLPLGVQLREGDLAVGSDDTELLKELWRSDPTPGQGADVKKIEGLLAVFPKPYRPSGGEKQRMFLAMALKKIDIMVQRGRLNRQSVFIFDEPTGSLDNYFRDIFLSLLFRRFQRHKLTTLLITHDYSMVGEITRRHGRLLDHVSFKELRLENEKLVLKDFQPQVYLGWLQHQKEYPVKEPSLRCREPLCRVESGAEVFGQQLIISKDQSGDEESALEILPGTMTYLKAPSGTGKTTLVKLMMGLIAADRLRLTLEDVQLTERTARHYWRTHIWGQKMTMVFQHADEALNPRSTVAETFEGLPSRKRVTPRDIRQILGELFEIEINDDFLRRRVGALSGGQKQRLNLLRSLSLNTEILILDEPLNGLDFESATKVLAMLREQQQGGKAMLVISHNEEIFDALVSKDSVYYLHSKRAHS
jgi:peptide/nickel transport system ATP-binding protein